MGISQHLDDALDDADHDRVDAAAAALARRYARALDTGAANVADIGPKFLNCLESLLMTPRARAYAKRKDDNGAPKPASPLDELQARRDRRSGSA